MAGYKEFYNDYSLMISAAAVTGTRAFYKSPNGPATLPEINDKFNTAYPQCKCNKITHKKLTIDRVNDASFGGTEADFLEKITCEYTTEKDTGRGDFDEDQRRYSMGGEVLTVDNPTYWQWDDDEPVAQPIYISNVIGSFTRQVRFSSTATKNNWLREKAEIAAGCINHAEFEGHRIGSVLFSGISGGNHYDEDGNEFWVFDVEFTYRLIRDENAAITQDDWLYIWRKNSSGGKWDKPDVGGKYLYAKKNLANLFGAGGVGDIS